VVSTKFLIDHNIAELRKLQMGSQLIGTINSHEAPTVFFRNMHRFRSVLSVMNSLHSIFRLLCEQLTLCNSLANPNYV
jgi:hypothetical protein